MVVAVVFSCVFCIFPLALSTPAGTICFHCGDFCGLPPLPQTQILRILEIRRIENTFIFSALLVLLLLGILWSFLSGSVNGALIVATKCSKCQYFDARDPDSLPYVGALIDCPVSNQAKRPAQSQNLSRFHLFCSKIVRNLTPYRRLTQPLSMCRLPLCTIKIYLCVFSPDSPTTERAQHVPCSRAWYFRIDKQIL